MIFGATNLLLLFKSNNQIQLISLCRFVICHFDLQPILRVDVSVADVVLVLLFQTEPFPLRKADILNSPESHSTAYREQFPLPDSPSPHRIPIRRYCIRIRSSQLFSGIAEEEA